jgi:hypothetical protein
VCQAEARAAAGIEAPLIFRAASSTLRRRFRFRDRNEAAVATLVALLDVADGDADLEPELGSGDDRERDDDLEPSLGAPEETIDCQPTWAWGRSDDREFVAGEAQKQAPMPERIPVGTLGGTT